MANRVTKWEANDGSLFDNEYNAIKHDAVGNNECPVCHGKGKLDGEPITKKVFDEEATAWGGQFASKVYKDVTVGHKQIVCSTCQGQGWTIDKLKPITETKIVGYE